MESKSSKDDVDHVCDPCNMNSTDFNPDIYMIKVNCVFVFSILKFMICIIFKILKESRLSELMDTEQMLYKQIQTLDSEMQTLIYENYNKFISATETVKKVSNLKFKIIVYYRFIRTLH